MEQIKNLNMDCKGCGGICCNTMPINILKPEAERLRALKPDLKLKDFGEFFYIEPPCPFFQDNKCSIYKLRPIICRSFPIQINENEGTFIWFKRLECPEANKLKGMQ
jgi:Fe-S-cluster containining protein